MANSADVYVEQINEGLNRWALSHARLCGENWMVEVNTHINMYVPQSTLGDDWDWSPGQAPQGYEGDVVHCMDRD